jgi:hypothetical protein
VDASSLSLRGGAGLRIGQVARKVSRLSWKTCCRAGIAPLAHVHGCIHMCHVLARESWADHVCGTLNRCM